MKQYHILLIFTLLLCACRQFVPSQEELLTADACQHDSLSYHQDSLKLTLTPCNDSLSILRLQVRGTVRDTLAIPYPVYRFDCGDLTADGLPEVVIGVVKGTRYWPSPARRLFIYHLFRGWYIRPLWLGSRLSSPLHDFRVCRDSVPAYIVTQEWGADSTLIERQYQMGGFGLVSCK